MELEKQGAQTAGAKAILSSGGNLSTLDAYRLLAQSVAPSVLIDKSPLNAGRLEWLQRAEEISSDVRYLHLVRHPAAVIDSLCRNRLDIGGRPTASLVAELLWTRANANVLSFLEGVDGPRRFIVRYEDLVVDPRGVLRRIIDFLGLDFNDAVLHPYDGERMTEGVDAGRPSLGDPLFRTHKEIESNLADSWRTANLPFGLGEEAKRLARRFSYQVTEETMAAANPSRKHTAISGC